MLGDLEDYSRGLVCLTGGEEGPLAAALMSGGETAGRASVERLVRIFGQQMSPISLKRNLDFFSEAFHMPAVKRHD